MTYSIDRKNGPQIPDVGVVAMVPEPWGVPWQSRHHILSRLARYFHVAWVSPASEWRWSLRSVERPNSNGAAANPAPGLIAYEPEFWLPKLYRSKRLANFTFDARLRRARQLLVERGCRNIVLYIWRPEFARALRSITYDLSCYHIDDEYSFSDVEVPPDPLEMALIVAVDQVFVHSPGLIDKKGGLNSHTTFVPNGVDYQAYAQSVPEPADLAPIPHPRIGYTGLIKKQLDWPLLLHLARKHRQWSFVFVGPRSPHPEIFSILDEISGLPNVYFLGAKSVWELAAYPQHFDVCLMPYAGNKDASKYIYPLKLHEYLASGRPAISSPIRSVRDFSEVIALANGPDEWSRAITDALGERANCLESVARRQDIARGYDWDKLVHLIAQTLCERLGSGILRRFHEIASSHCGQERTLRS